MAQFDCRAVAIFSLLLVLILLGGIVLFRHHHGHHLTHRSPSDNTMENVCPNCDCESAKYLQQSNEVEPLTQWNYENDEIPMPTAIPIPRLQLSEMCLQCICMTATECKPSNCSDSVCGIFRLSKPYWIDGGKPIVTGFDNSISDNAYRHCVNNPFCSARAVENYMRRYSRDFNGDGQIDCEDFVRLHMLGPTGASKGWLTPTHQTRFDKCLKGFQ